MTKLILVGPAAVPATWPRIETMMVAAAARSNGRYTAEDIRKYFLAGTWQLWIALDDLGICAVGVTELKVYPTGLRAIEIHIGTGRNRRNWQHLIDDILVWARSQECCLAEGSFRLGWRRIFTGWKHTHDVLEQVL